VEHPWVEEDPQVEEEDPQAEEEDPQAQGETQIYPAEEIPLGEYSYQAIKCGDPSLTTLTA
jgi:hypothetical protein